jgi:hypothetical protein
VNDSTTNKVAAFLAVYWRQHPAACDTPEGMRRWWLYGRVDISTAEVEEALAWMIERTLVEQRRTGAHCIYRLRVGGDPRELQALAESVTADSR